MEKLLFVDHAYHQKTRSADFFVDVLRRAYAVETCYLAPEQRPDPSVLAAAHRADIVVLWQLDFLAPVFLAMGKRVIVIPMFDGSGGMPDLHWLFAARARFCNFSLVLHERIRMAGGATMLLRYFPEPVAEADLPRFDRLRAFFWQRRPDHGIHFDLVDRLIGHELDALHLHNVADVPGRFSPQPRRDAGYAYSESTWFRDKADYAACLAQANVFIAPRVAEGIGMALLEAMAQGKLVLAHDAPTNSEYISSWQNGILFNKDHEPSPICIWPVAERLGRMAWRTVVEGRRQWLAAHPAIIEWIAGSTPGPAVDHDHQAFFTDLWHAYYAGIETYTAFLGRQLGLLARLTDRPFSRLLDIVGEARASQATARAGRDCALDGDGLLDLTRADDRFIGSGWSNAEEGWRWAIGYKSELFFAAPHLAGGKVRCRFTASALPELGKWVQLAIVLNDSLVFEGRITPGWSDYRFDFDPALLRPENRLVLAFDKASSLPTDSRVLSVCFKQFSFANR